MDKPIKVTNGILEQIKHPYYITGTITKKGIFKDMMKLYEDFYKEYPYALKWDYEKSISEFVLCQATNANSLDNLWRT